MEVRFHLKWWWMTGVRPRGAQVRRTTGSSETPDSSQNTMAALRRRARARILVGERWWSAEALAAATGEWFLPPSLPVLLPDILAGRYDDTPIELDQ